MVYLVYGIVLIFLTYESNSLSADDFEPEGGRITVANPKYVKNATIFTHRKSRKSLYYTEAKVEILHSWGNNVSFRFEHYSLKDRSDAFRAEFKICDLLKHEWVLIYVNETIDIGDRRCPFPPGIYKTKKIQFPPKNFPLSLKKQDYRTRGSYYKMSTKENLLEIELTFRVKKERKNN